MTEAQALSPLLRSPYTKGLFVSAFGGFC
uniref:Uncharacterized protein n=1 Tax=Arundo donax TaxID=35708 RepID=A0A0A9EKB5_ARUDO